MKNRVVWPGPYSLDKTFKRKLFYRVSQLYNYFCGFIKCQIIFSGLESKKRLRNREKYGLHTIDLFLPIANENFIITRVFRMIYKI